MKKYCGKFKNGFSLLEVVVAIFIIGTIFLLYQACSNAILLTRNAKNQEIALRVANNKMEELRATGYTALPANGSFTDSLLGSLPNSSANMTFNDFNSDTKHVLIIVQWQDSGSVSPVTVSLDSLITKVGGL